MSPQERLPRVVPRNTFLLEPYIDGPVMLLQSLIQELLIGGQRRQLNVRALFSFLTPERSVGQQGLPVHQDRAHVREEGAYATENPQAVSIEISPVHALGAAHPRKLCDRDMLQP